MRHAMIIAKGLGVDLICNGIVTHFECTSQLVNHCKENNIDARWVQYP